MILNADYDYDTIHPLYFVINCLIGYIEEIVIIKIKDYDKFRFNSDIDLPSDTSTEFRSLVTNVSCVIEKDNEYYPEIYLYECLYIKGNEWPTTT